MTAILNAIPFLPKPNFKPDDGGGAPEPSPSPDPAPAPAPDPSPDPAPDPNPNPDPAPSPDPEPASAWGEIDDELKEFIGDKTPADVAKELKGAQSLLGKKQIGIPNEDSTPEEWAKFHETRGVPEKSEGYDFGSIKEDLLKDVPEAEREKAWDKDGEARFRELAKAANLSQTEASELLRRELAHRTETNQQAQQDAAKVSKAANDLIVENWGNKQEEYTQDANVFARHVGIEGDVLEAIQKLAGTSAETRFKLVDFMRQQGAQLREGGQPGTTAAGAVPASSMTPDQARVAKTDYLAQGDNRNAYMDSNHPNHEMVTKQVTEYLKAERA